MLRKIILRMIQIKLLHIGQNEISLFSFLWIDINILLDH